MQLSHFVIIHEGVHEDENVLCSVLSNRYVGVDDAALEADVARELSAQGFLVEDHAVYDRGLREHLEKGSPAFKMTTNRVLLDRPFVEVGQPVHHRSRWARLQVPRCGRAGGRSDEALHIHRPLTIYLEERDTSLARASDTSLARAMAR